MSCSLVSKHRTPSVTIAGRSKAAALRDKLRVRNERLGDALSLLAHRGAIVRIGDRWAVPVPAST
jgi:hypothetical protein